MKRTTSGKPVLISPLPQHMVLLLLHLLVLLVLLPPPFSLLSPPFFSFLLLLVFIVDNIYVSRDVYGSTGPCHFQRQLEPWVPEKQPKDVMKPETDCGSSASSIHTMCVVIYVQFVPQVICIDKAQSPFFG